MILQAWCNISSSSEINVMLLLVLVAQDSTTLCQSAQWLCPPVALFFGNQAAADAQVRFADAVAGQVTT